MKRLILNCMASAGILLSTLSAFANDANYKKFFGHSVSFKLGACRPNDKECGPTIAKVIKFDEKGNLTEAFMCGDPVERRHTFGKLNQITSKAPSTNEKSIGLSGSGNSIEIKSWLKIVYSDGDTHEKTDNYEFSTDDGATCVMKGSREMVDKPSGERRVVPIVSADCRIY